MFERLFCHSYIKQENKELPLFSCACVGFDLFSRSVSRQVFSALQSLTSVFGMGTGGPSALEKPTRLSFPQALLCQHRPIFPARLHASIVGTAELNFCVRNGNRWTLCVNNTDYDAPSGIQPSDTSLTHMIKDRSLYHFLGLVHLQGFEPGTH